ncbi:MAG: LamG domain-containing protein [Planctomycetota bacterium]
MAICPSGYALQFDGADDYVDCGNDSSLNVGDGSYTLAAWIKTALSPRGAILAKMRDGASHQGYDALVNTDGTIQAHLISSWNSNAIRVLGSTAINDGDWHRVVVTYDGSNSASGFSIYIDGKPETLTITHDSLSGSTLTDASFTIGSRDGGQYLNSKIDEVAIYNRALSAEEIWANMHTRLTGDEPGLVCYWDFDEGEGQIVYDLSGNGNNGQLGSTPNPDVSDPAWEDSDAPIGICNPYLIATRATDGAVERKTAMLEELLVALAQEWTAYEALEELLEGGDYGDLNKGDIVTAKQKIHSATQHEEQAIDALEKSIEKLKDALSALGYEPEPPPM